jgi:hypothetical protein
MRRVTKPCPACKSSEHPRGAADDICIECHKLIDFAKKRQEEDKCKPDAGEVEVWTWEQAHAMPHYWVDSVQNVYLRNGTDDVLLKAMHHLIFTLSSECGSKAWEWYTESEEDKAKMEKASRRPVVPGEHNKKHSSRSHDWACVRKMQKHHVKAIQDLQIAIMAALNSIAKEAHEKGSSLLLGLASGDTTVKEFNEATLEK